MSLFTCLTCKMEVISLHILTAKTAKDLPRLDNKISSVNQSKFSWSLYFNYFFNNLREIKHVSAYQSTV